GDSRVLEGDDRTGAWRRQGGPACRLDPSRARAAEQQRVRVCPLERRVPPMLRHVGFLFCFAFGLTLLGLYVAGFIMYLTYVPQGLRSRTWPSVVGHVQQSQTTSYGRGSILHVEYEFQVNGVGYASSRFRFSPKNGPSTGEA